MNTVPILPKLIGRRIKRREDPRLVRGRATYVDDVKIHGLRHLAFKRSDVAHGRIRSVDTRAAAAVDGVEAVLTGTEIAGFLGPMPIGTPFPSPDHHAVAVDTVRFVGEPVAVVVAPRPLRGARRRRRGGRRLRAAAGGGRSGTGDDRAAGGAARRLSDQRGPRSAVAGDGHPPAAAGGRHRRRRGVRGGRHGDLAADREPAGWPRTRSSRAGWWRTTRGARTS